MWHCSVPKETAPLYTAGQQGTGVGFPAMCACLSPRKGRVVVPVLAVSWHAGSAHLLLLAMFLGLYSQHVPLVTSISPGTPTAEPVRHRGWQSAWWCRAKCGLVWSCKPSAMGPPWVPSTPRD